MVVAPLNCSRMRVERRSNPSCNHRLTVFVAGVRAAAGGRSRRDSEADDGDKPESRSPAAQQPDSTHRSTVG